MLKINSQKIALILVVLMTVACSDPKDSTDVPDGADPIDKYIALNCRIEIEIFRFSMEIIMDGNSRTFSTYSDLLSPGSIMKEVTRGVYSNDGDNYYLLTHTESAFDVNEEGEVVREFKDISDHNDQSRIDRRTLELQINVNSDDGSLGPFLCKEIAVPDYNKNKI